MESFFTLCAFYYAAASLSASYVTMEPRRPHAYLAVIACHYAQVLVPDCLAACMWKNVCFLLFCNLSQSWKTNIQIMLGGDLTKGRGGLCTLLERNKKREPEQSSLSLSLCHVSFVSLPVCLRVHAD